MIPQDIEWAQKAIATLVRRTPLIYSPRLSEKAGVPVHLKLENLQETGSFKIRGAANRMLNLTEEQKACGVITVSTGNHGRAVAYVAQALGIQAIICMSERVPESKVRAIQELGAEVVVVGQSYDEAEEHSFQLEREGGLTRIEPFDDPFVIAGQGTIGLELLEDLPEIDTAIVPLSGGGLVGGIGLAVKARDPAIRVIGVSMERAPVMVHSLRAGRPIEMEELPTLADALVGGIGLDNRYTFRLVQQYVDETVLVGEEAIAAAIRFVHQQHQLVVEGGGAVGIAGLLQGKIGNLGGNTAIVVSGGNINPALLHKILQKSPVPNLGEAEAGTAKDKTW
jgi:threonine dehydratase